MSARRILVVDDSPFTGEVVAWALRGAGFVVDVARDLWDLERADLAIPDLVLMDVVLEEAFGDDLAMLLRGARGYECPIVLLSSLPDPLLARRTAEAELDGYISKQSGLAAIVARVREVLGDASSPARATGLPPSRFDVMARQRVRRILHVASIEGYWNATAIAGETHALAGDAELAGATPLAEAARVCRDVIQMQGAGGMTAETRTALAALTAELPDAGINAGVVLAVMAGAFYQDQLLPELDAAGFTVVEARSLVELRPKLHAARYALIIVDDVLRTSEPTMMTEIEKTSARIAIVCDAGGELDGKPAISRGGGAKGIVEEVVRLAKK